MYNEELHNFYSSPSIIKMMNTMRMRWAGNAARMGRRGIHRGFWWERRKARDHQKDIDVGGMIILKWYLREIGWCGMDWIDLAQDRDQSRALVNIVMKLWVPYNIEKFLNG
jgi:hypothetical protein